MVIRPYPASLESNRAMNIGKKLSSIKIRKLLVIMAFLCALPLLYSLFSAPRHKFMELRDENVVNQWENIETLIVASKHHRVPLLLFDIDILPNIFVARDKTWKDALHRCKVLCKHHPEEKNVITFAALYTKFQKSKKEFMDALRHLGFTVHLSEVTDPKRPKHDGKLGQRPTIPSYLWMARNDHIIHIALMHERGDENKYLWVAPVSDREWKKTVAKLAPTLTDGWHSLELVGAKFPRYAQAYDMSYRFTGYPVHLDGHRISVPYHIQAFLEEYSNSRFIECGQARVQNHAAVNNSSNRQGRGVAQAMMTEVKKIMDRTEIPFWITGGTLLGWYRQCSFMPHDSDLDVAIWSRQYRDQLVDEMKDKGYTYISDLAVNGNSGGGYFLNEKGNKLNLLMFEQGDGVVTNIRERREDGVKFVLTYPPFQLCWTEFVGNKVQIPCDALAYLERYFGRNWFIPNRKWVWHIDAENKALLQDKE